jgi:hypothetical protein
MSALHIPQPDTVDLPPVRSAAEYGAKGAAIAHARYKPAQFAKWGALGGRPADPRITSLAATGRSARKTTRRAAIER